MGQARILCVDDEPLNLDILDSFLGDKYRLTLVDSGYACLESVKLQKPDIILLDIHMPGMDGIEVCRTLKSDPATQDIIIIYLTALADSIQIEKGKMSGCNAYVTKPVNFDELELLIASYL